MVLKTEDGCGCKRKKQLELLNKSLVLASFRLARLRTEANRKCKHASTTKVLHSSWNNLLSLSVSNKQLQYKVLASISLACVSSWLGGLVKGRGRVAIKLQYRWRICSRAQIWNFKQQNKPFSPALMLNRKLLFFTLGAGGEGRGGGGGNK